jgi:hypothetical protein
MSPQNSVTSQPDRRSYIGGSDARTIRGRTALVRLWREKRGEVGPKDLSNNLIVHRQTQTAAQLTKSPALGVRLSNLKIHSGALASSANGSQLRIQF